MGRKAKSWIKDNRLLTAIIAAVLAAHLLALTYMSIEKRMPPALKSGEKKIAVKTVALSPPQELKAAPKRGAEEVALAAPEKKTPEKKPQEQQQEKKREEEKSKEKKKNREQEKSKAKAEEKKLPPKKKESKPKKVEESAKTPPPKKEEKGRARGEKAKNLLKEAQQTLAKIEKRSDNMVADSKKAAAADKRLNRVSLLSEKASEGGKSALEGAYSGELIRELQKQLKLPEEGDVEVKLTLDRRGRVIAIAILSSKSDANRDLIEKMLPTLSLPPFNDCFKGCDSRTFRIALTNE